MNTDNCAIVSFDLFTDLDLLFERPDSISPIEFHALNSLVEAVVFHEKLYLYDLPIDHTSSALLNRLFKEGIVHSHYTPEIFEVELKRRGMTDLSNHVLLDRTYGSKVVGYHPDSGADLLSSLIDYEKNLGFSRMSELQHDNSQIANIAANAYSFSSKDVVVIDDTYRRARAFSSVASALGLEMYTGVIQRNFVLGFLSWRRRGALALYERMKEELDDVSDTDIPSWKRIQIPPLCQLLLKRCGDSSDAMPDELMRLRHELRKFRTTLTEQVHALKSVTGRGQKRKIRRETDKAWDALLEREDRSTRLSHQIWDVTKNPLTAPIAIVDKLVEMDKLDQVILKVQGLTDLWRTLYDAPVIEENVRLLQKVFGATIDESRWFEISRLAQDLEVLATRNQTPSMPATS